ncbi:MAG: hypothetical protein GWO20_03075 [Candidatus Korarchaeota archaeon]|nr:hypothetical protein [Candidatus Korarchaeota archaeon]NIU82469.1 hypothetical protein [Candidatus Thorarchaeota archaeon]NIW15749.1 hypothetical protein [Candidatus Thorarchaeota archaeon]NIW51108.1 hypothetical protein [Candidatus Korarchaeota archaeon]
MSTCFILKIILRDHIIKLIAYVLADHTENFTAYFTVDFTASTLILTNHVLTKCFENGRIDQREILNDGRMKQLKLPYLMRDRKRLQHQIIEKGQSTKNIKEEKIRKHLENPENTKWIASSS